tara:strand:+ start:159 stop:662 length:504 start_codon:yes stop_codon:yes gene_type:complete
MNSRFVPITIAIVSFLLAIFAIDYLNGVWRWIVAMPLIFFVALPSAKIGIFSSQEEVDTMTGSDKLDSPINPYLLLTEVLSFSRYIAYALTAYFAFIEYPFYIVPLLTLYICFAKAFTSIRFNLTYNAKGKNGFVGIIKMYPFFYLQDFIIVSVIYGLGVIANGIFA